MVFNRALLPRAVRIAKIGVEPQRFVGCELTSIVECDRGQGLLWHRFEEPPGGRGRGEAFLSGLLGRQNEARFLFGEDERVAAAAAEDHQVAFPIAEGQCALDLGWPFVDRYPVWDYGLALAEAGPSSASRLRLGKIIVQLLLAALRTVNEAVDGLGADYGRRVEPPGPASVPSQGDCESAPRTGSGARSGCGGVCACAAAPGARPVTG